MRFDFFQPGSSWLHRLDPRVKLLGVVVTFAAIFLVDNPWAAGAIVAFQFVVFATARLDWQPLRSSFFFMAYLALVSTILWSVLGDSGEVLFSVGPLNLRSGAAAYGLLVGLRIVAMMLAPLVMLVSTRQDDLVQGLSKLGMPHKAAFTFGMALRMLPTTAGTTMTIRDAQRARGLEFDKGNPVAKMKKNLTLLVPLTLLSFDRVDRMSLAIASRGLGASPQRTYIRSMRLRAVDKAVLIGFAVVLVVLVLLRVGVST